MDYCTRPRAMHYCTRPQAAPGARLSLMQAAVTLSRQRSAVSGEPPLKQSEGSVTTRTRGKSP
jgi:hypothetical protein